MHVFPNLNVKIAPGTVVPVVIYTNCFSVELLVNGRSWGVKAYEFPAQGMTQHWPHFDHPFAPVTTSDLHLSWDVPFDPGDTWLAIGRDSEGKEVIRQEIRMAGHAVSLQVTADRSSIPADGRSVVQLDMALLDAAGNCAVNDDKEITVQLEGGTLLGMDNGSPKDHTLYRTGHRKTFQGLAYAVVRKDGTRQAARSSPLRAWIGRTAPLHSGGNDKRLKKRNKVWRLQQGRHAIDARAQPSLFHTMQQSMNHLISSRRRSRMYELDLTQTIVREKRDLGKNFRGEDPSGRQISFTNVSMQVNGVPFFGISGEVPLQPCQH